MALLPPTFLDTVAAIGVGADEQHRHWIGTGFIFGLVVDPKEESKRYRLFVITNKHVFRGNKEVYIKLNSAVDTTSTDYKASLISRNGKPAWVGHPDPNVDVAALVLSAGFLRSENRQFAYFMSDENVWYDQELRKYTITEGDRVFVLGFPMGMVSAERQYVICRGGFVARMRDYLDNKARDYLIDSTVFPGNSGGPVIICPSALAIEGTMQIPMAALIGIVKSYVPYRELAVSPQTGATRMMFEENSGLAAVESSASIVETAKLAVKRLQMRAAFAKYRAKRAAGTGPQVASSRRPRAEGAQSAPEAHAPGAESNPTTNVAGRRKQGRKA